MSRRSDILGHVSTILTNVTGMGTVISGKYRDIDLDATTLPVAFADYGDDRVAEAGMGFEAFVVPLDVEVWCHDTDRETLLGLVHAAMVADVTISSHALNTTRTTCRLFFVDAGRSLTGFILSFDILYRHPRGTP
jgi:hypothetical protein